MHSPRLRFASKERVQNLQRYLVTRATNAHGSHLAANRYISIFERVGEMIERYEIYIHTTCKLNKLVGFL